MTKFVGNSITFPKLSAAPSSPVSGDTYYDTTFNKPFTYNGTEWIDLTLTSATTGATGYWGSFWSTQDQTAASANTEYLITYNNTDADSSGVSIVSNSRMTFAYTGVYSIIYSVQFVNTSNDITDTNVWLKKNGSNVADTDSRWSVVGSHGGVDGHAIGTVNFVLKVTAGDYLELAWQTTNTAVSLQQVPAASPAPAIPSIILTATQVMNTQAGPTGATGPAGPAATPTAMNYAQTQATKQSSVSASGVTIASASLTTNGYPVQVLVTGDAENSAAGGWIKLQLYRDSTAIGKQIHIESSAISENIPYSITVIDTPSAGTYTYALKTTSAAATGTFNFGETDGPVLTALELTGGVGPTGATGAAGVVQNISAGAGIVVGGTTAYPTISIASSVSSSSSGTPGTSFVKSLLADVYGRVISYENGSVQNASTTAAGIVQLSDSISTTSSTIAATPTAVKSAYDLANGKVSKSGDTITGTLAISSTADDAMTVAGAIKLATGGNDNAIYVGDDSIIFDADTGDTMGIKGQQTAANGAIVFGSGKDTNIYRGGANILKTDDAFVAGSYIQSGMTAQKYNNGGTATDTTGVGTGYSDVPSHTVTFTPSYVGQRWLISFVGSCTTNNATAQYVIYQVFVDGGNLFYVRTYNPASGINYSTNVSGSDIYTSVGTTAVVCKVGVRMQTSTGVTVSTYYGRLNAVPLP